MLNLSHYVGIAFAVQTAYNEGDWDLIPGSVRSRGEGNSTILQYSCLGNPTDREAWWVTVHGVIKELDMT